jgi:hypothetical protein
MNEEKLMEVAKVQAIPTGNMYHVEIDRKEIAIANIDGKYVLLKTDAVTPVLGSPWEQ